MEFRTERTLLSCLALLILFLSAPLTGAEGEWEWTRNAGWARMEGMAKGTPTEQLAYAREIEERGEYYEAARQYFLLVRTFPNSSEAGTAMNNLARCLFQNENFYQSFQAIETFLKNYPKSAHLNEMMDLEYRIGRRFLAGARVSLLDEEYNRRKSLRAAVEVFQAIIGHDGYGKYADKAYYNMGEALLELGEPRPAKDAFNMVVVRFPESDLVPLARYKVKLCNIPLGQGSVADAMQELERLRNMQSSRGEESSLPQENQQVLQQSQEDLKSREAARMIQAGGFYEKRNSPKAYAAALFTYEEVVRRFPDTPEAKTARDRIARLEEEGKPDPDIGDRNFSLPTPSLKGLKKIKPSKWAFWRKDGDEEEQAQGQPEGAARDHNTLAPQTVTAKDLQNYPALDVTPIKPQVYNAGGEGNIFIDLEAEEARLRNIESGALPAEQAIAPQSLAPKQSPARNTATNRDEKLMPVPMTGSKNEPQHNAPAPVAKLTPAPTPRETVNNSQTGDAGTVVIDLSPENLAEEEPRRAPDPQPQPIVPETQTTGDGDDTVMGGLAAERGFARPASRPRTELDISPEAIPAGAEEVVVEKEPSVAMDATLTPTSEVEEAATDAPVEKETTAAAAAPAEATPPAQEKKALPEKPSNSGWIWGDDFK